jgi:hypothetical protein
MNFNISRVRQLLKNEWVLNKKNYLLGSVLISIILTIIFIGLARESYAYRDEGEQFLSYFFCLVSLGALITNLFFQDLKTKESSIHYLLQPATHFEKLFTKWLYTFFFFTIVFNILFYSIDIIYVYYCNINITPSEWRDKNKPLSVLKPFGAIWSIATLIYLLINAIYISGTVFFKKYAFVKTSILMLGLSLIFYISLEKFVQGKVASEHYDFEFVEFHIQKEPHINMPLFDDNLGIYNDWRTYYYPLSNSQIIVAIFLSSILVPLFMYIASWNRLKEKQV